MLRRRYANFNTAPAYNLGASAIPEENIIKEVGKIPLPNEFETETGSRKFANTSFLPDVFSKILGRIRLDDIILIGLIIVLLQERIEDEFLLIILIYILLT
jgi:hypothetical protein